MRKKSTVPIVLILFFIMTSISAGQGWIKVVIDPGHGGSAPGAIGNIYFLLDNRNKCIRL